MSEQIEDLELATGEDAERQAYKLEPKTVASVLYAVDIDDREKLTELMDPLHAADIADLLEQINAFDRSRLVRLYDREFDGGPPDAARGGDGP